MKDGILLVDKPESWTSFDVVAKIRGKIKAKYIEKGIKPTKKKLRVGHAGTLDPFATGLLIVLLGEKCKSAGEFLKLDKTYEFTARLGEVSTTGDPEGDITQSENRKPDIKEIKQVLKNLTGEITQVPPAYSAIKVGGRRAYKLAREGRTVDIPSRKVTIYKLQLTEYKYPYIKCVCEVSSGTYIRTLVEDIGKLLGTGTYCSQLRRTKIADFNVIDALMVEDVTFTLDN